MEKLQVEKKKLETLVNKLRDEHFSTTLIVEQLVAKKKHLEEQVAPLEEKLAKVHEDTKYLLQMKTKQAHEIIAAANKKDGEVATKIQEALRLEAKLIEQKKEQDILSASIDSKLADLATRERDFDLFRGTTIIELENRQRTQKEKADKDFADLARLQDANQEQLQKLAEEKEAIRIQREGLEHLAGVVASQQAILVEQKSFIEEKMPIVSRKEKELDQKMFEVEKQQKTLSEQAQMLVEGTRKLEQRNYDLDLKRREIETLEKKVQSLIRIHGIEKELEQYGGTR